MGGLQPRRPPSPARGWRGEPGSAPREDECACSPLPTRRGQGSLCAHCRQHYRPRLLHHLSPRRSQLWGRACCLAPADRNATLQATAPHPQACPRGHGPTGRTSRDARFKSALSVTQFVSPWGTPLLPAVSGLLPHQVHFESTQVCINHPKFLPCDRSREAHSGNHLSDTLGLTT